MTANMESSFSALLPGGPEDTEETSHLWTEEASLHPKSPPKSVTADWGGKHSCVH